MCFGSIRTNWTMIDRPLLLARFNSNIPILDCSKEDIFKEGFVIILFNMKMEKQSNTFRPLQEYSAVLNLQTSAYILYGCQ